MAKRADIMGLLAFLADISFEPNPNFLLPLAVGVAAGAGVLSAVQYFLRHRRPPEPPPASLDNTDPFVDGSASEQRIAFRRKGNAIDVVMNHPAVGGRHIEGVVIDRSVGGLCLLVDRALPVETNMTIRPLNASQIVPWTEVTVKSCRESDVGYEVGCQFVKIPPWPVLMLFG